MNKEEIINEIPDLYDWVPTKDQIYYTYNPVSGCCIASYDKVNMVDSPLWVYYINKNHYKNRMQDIVQHLNYYLNFYDLDRELFMGMLSIKYIVDTKPELGEDAFRELILDRLVTPKFISNCKLMASRLYVINTNTDIEGKYKNTPKITNAQAKMIMSLSFAFRLLIPICVHYANISSNFESKTYYLQVFSKIYIKIIRAFEKGDIKIYLPLCKFIDFRVEKSYASNKLIHYQKKQLRGDSLELYKDKLIMEVIIVKSMYKLDYRQSCVSFIDGVISKYNINYGRENYSNKPYEIDSNDSSNDSDEHMSRAEALEMQAYKIDESNPMISDANNEKVIKEIKQLYSSIEISEEEHDFYDKNCKLNYIADFLLHSFYSKKFNDSYALYSLSRRTTIDLLIYMKKILMLYKMPLLAQICTSNICGKYKDSIIKNAKLIERITSSNIYQQIIKKKYSYVFELQSKEDPILKMLSNIINCSYEFVDMNEEINGYKLTDIDMDDIVNEFLQFLSII